MKINIDSLRVKYNVIYVEKIFSLFTRFSIIVQNRIKKKLNKNSFTIVLFFEYAFYQNRKFIINIEH